MNPFYLRQWATLALLGFLTGSVEAEPSAPTVPNGARVRLGLDKTEYFLGEPIVLRFVVANVGKETFSINLGGDYRGAPRSLRYKVTAIDQDGNEAPDPTPDPIYFGGISSGRDIAPGTEHIATLDLHLYRRLEKAGSYSVSVTHDLGWEGTRDRPVPVAKVSITVKMPTPPEARRIVQRMALDPENDFSTLGYPVYLTVLKERAQKVDVQALEGIGCIATPEATLALIESTGHSDTSYARHALKKLAERLPHPQRGASQESRNRLVEMSWRDAFAPLVREAARRLLRETSQKESVFSAADVLAHIGTHADVLTLTRALDEAIKPIEEREFAPRAPYDFPLNRFHELNWAAQGMAKRGVEPVVPEARSPGEQIYFVRAIQSQGKYRPSNWQKTFAQSLRSDVALVRETALTCLPRSDQDTFVPIVKDLLGDPCLKVQFAACGAAATLEAKSLRDPVLQVLRTATNLELFRAADEAATLLGTGIARLDIVIDRLTEPKLARACLESLTSIVKWSGRSGPGEPTSEEAVRCQQAWRRFLKDHQKELTRGHKWRCDDPTLPVAELFPHTEFSLQ